MGGIFATSAVGPMEYRIPQIKPPPNKRPPPEKSCLHSYDKLISTINFLRMKDLFIKKRKIKLNFLRKKMIFIDLFPSPTNPEPACKWSNDKPANE